MRVQDQTRYAIFCLDVFILLKWCIPFFLSVILERPKDGPKKALQKFTANVLIEMCRAKPCAILSPSNINSI